MNPQSRMVIFAVTLLFGLAPARAADLWKEVKTPKGTFYTPKGGFDSFVGNSVFSGDHFLYTYPGAAALKDQKAWPRWKLFKHYGPEDPKCPAFVKARLAKPPQGVAQELLRLVVYDLKGKGKASDSQLWVSAAKDIDPKTYNKPPANNAPGSNAPVVQKPSEVDDEVWGLLSAVKSNKALYAQVLQMVKKSHPTEYEAIKAGKLGNVINAMAAIIKELKGKPINAASIYAVLTSSVGGSKSRLQAALDTAAAPVNTNQPKPGDVTGAPVDGKEGDQTSANPITILIALLTKDPAAVQDVSDRFAQYVLQGEGKGFISAEVRKSRDDFDTAISSACLAWTKARMEKKADSVAELYFVMGADAAPAWAKGSPILSNALTNKEALRSGLFYERMKIWAQPKPDAHGAGQCTDAKVVDWLGRFLGGDKAFDADPVSAVNVAHAILANPKVKDELSRLAADIAANASSGVAVKPGQGGPTIKGPAKGFSFGELYESGALVNPAVMASGDPSSRRISIKVMTVWEGDKLVDKVGVYDITNRGDIYGRKFPLTTGNNSVTFQLDERVTGYPKYTFATEPQKNGDTMVYFGREGNEKQMGVPLSKLYQDRAQQALDSGSRMTVGGKEYYVMGQGGKNGSLLLFPPDLEQKKSGYASPELVADVNARQGALDVNLPGKLRLGTVGVGEAAKKYHVKYNPDLGYWEAAEGDWDHPVETPANSSGTVPSGGPNPPPPSDNTATANIDAQLAKDGYAPNDKVRKGLAKEYQDKVRVWSLPKDDKRPFEERHRWIVPEDLWKDRLLGMPTPPQDAGVADVFNDDEVRGVLHYIGVTRRFTTMYFDLAKGTPVDTNRGIPYPRAGAVVKGDISIQDATLMADAADRAGYKEAEIKVAQKNLVDVIAQYGKSEGKELKYEISSKPSLEGKPMFVAFDTKGGYRFYPTVQPAPDIAPPTHPDAEGPGFGYDQAGIISGPGAAEPLAEKAQGRYGKDQAEDIFRVALAENKGAALYANDKDQAKATHWYMIYKLESKAEGPLRLRDYIWVFSNKVEDQKAYPTVRPYPGKAVGLSGLSWSSFPRDGELALYKAEGKGVWYAVAKKNLNKDNAPELAKNCVGPVLWWGMDAKAAKDICEANKRE